MLQLGRVLHTLLESFNRFYFFMFDRIVLYPLLRWLHTKFDMQFLNLGYEPNPDEEVLQVVASLNDGDTAERAHVYLYEKTLSMCSQYGSLRGKRLLEVGCGHGAGIKWLIRAHPELEEVLGVDCVVVDSLDDRIIVGNAECLPYDDNSFDIVLNVESSHLYRDEMAFYRECVRVLRPGGSLCWTDIRYPHKLDETLTEAGDAGLVLASYANITEQVLRGIKQTTRRYDAMLDRAPWIVRLFHNSLRATYCAPGTEPYRRLERHEKVYTMACWINTSCSDHAHYDAFDKDQ